MPRLLFILVAFVAAAFGAEPEKGIVFCTYNVRNYVGEDQAAPPDRRARPKSDKELDSLISVIRDVSPDILGVCEMGSEKMFTDFKARLAKAGLEYPHS